MALDQRYNILEVASRKTQLRPSGNEYLGCCPFHQEKTPSFFVNPQDNVFYCFGCGKGGDVYTLLSLFEGKPRSHYTQQVAPGTLDQFRKQLLEHAQGVKAPAHKQLFAAAYQELAALFKNADKRLVALHGSPLKEMKGNVSAHTQWLHLQHLFDEYWAETIFVEWQSRNGHIFDPFQSLHEVLQRANQDVAELLAFPVEKKPAA